MLQTVAWIAMTARTPRLIAAISLALAAFALTGCTQPVPMEPGDSANTTECADVIVRLPNVVADHSQRDTNAQSTAAWGSPARVLLRCGVTPIGPTTQPCVTVDGVDWVLETEPDADVVQYITFGRTPAVEIAISHSHSDVGLPIDAEVLPALAPAVESIPQTKACIGPEDTDATAAP